MSNVTFYQSLTDARKGPVESSQFKQFDAAIVDTQNCESIEFLFVDNPNPNSYHDPPPMQMI
jgi:hypothetical protein